MSRDDFRDSLVRTGMRLLPYRIASSPRFERHPHHMDAARFGKHEGLDDIDGRTRFCRRLTNITV